MADDPQPVGPAAETATSRSLLMQLKEGQPAAWERVTSLYAPLVYRWCRAMRLPEQDMPDVFQQVFQSVASHIEGFHKDRPGDTFRSWLRAITRNKVRDHFRRSARQPQAAGGTDAQVYFSQVADLPAEGEESSDDEEGEVRQLLRGALEQIRGQVHPQTWQAFWKVVVEGKTPEEVGEELGMRPGTVRVAKSRVLSRLRSQLGELLL
jgi:RNA polymerase sigma-70 factor (ECF subfamily)